MSILRFIFYLSEICNGLIPVFSISASIIAVYGVKESKKKDDKQSLSRWGILLISSVIILVASVSGTFLVEVPRVIDYHYEDARTILIEDGFQYSGSMNNGEKVKDQYPVPGEIVSRGAVVLLYGYDHPVTAPTVSEGAETLPQTGPPVGSTFFLGEFEQDCNTSNGAEPIEWIVLDTQNDSILAISRYALDCRPYHSTYSDTTWQSSSIRQWLNTSFYNTAFSSSDKNQIVSSQLSHNDNPIYNSDSGSDTTDKVFLLSLEEASTYFHNNEDRACIATKYAIKNGAYLNKTTGCSWWWLRSPGETNKDASSINSDGSIDYDDGKVTSNKGTIRPAIRVTLE